MVAIVACAWSDEKVGPRDWIDFFYSHLFFHSVWEQLASATVATQWPVTRSTVSGQNIQVESNGSIKRNTTWNRCLRLIPVCPCILHQEMQWKSRHRDWWLRTTSQYTLGIGHCSHYSLFLSFFLSLWRKSQENMGSRGPGMKWVQCKREKWLMHLLIRMEGKNVKASCKNTQADISSHQVYPVNGALNIATVMAKNKDSDQG